MTDYVVFRLSDGAIVKGGSAPEAEVPHQAGEGERAVAVPPGTLAWPNINLEPLRVHLCRNVDEQAGAVRSQFITVIPGQEATYIYKAAEAKAWRSGNDPDTAPFLSAEAAATGVTIDELALTVEANEAAWRELGARIEAARIGAKVAIARATAISTVVSAADVDWQSLVTPL